jgi:hypothetical protein
MCVLLAAAIAGCGNDDGLESHPIQGEENQKLQEENFSDEAVPVQVLTGYTSGNQVKTPTVVIARNDDDLKKLKKAQFSNGVKKDSMAPVEFPQQQIVAVTLPKSAPGTSVTITDVYPKDGQVHVKAVELVPGAGCITQKQKPYPFHWVGTRMMEGTPDLELVKQKGEACQS